MKGFLENKSKIGCIVLVVILVILATKYVTLNKQNNVLKNEAINNMYAEWNQLYYMFEYIDKYYIKNNFQDAERFRLYVNQACHHFYWSVRPSELTVNMRDLLTQAYDPLNGDLYLEERTLNKEKAIEIFKSMNEDLMLISKSVVDMYYIKNEKEKLLDTTSPEYKKVNKQVKEVSEKYIKLVEDYFREYKKIRHNIYM